MPLSRNAAGLVLALVSVLGTSAAVAQEPFYKGKRLTLLINFAAGGPDRHRGPAARQAHRQAYRRPAADHRAEPRRRRRPGRHQLCRRGRPARRQHVRLLHRRGLEIRDGAGEAHRRFPHLRVHRLSAGQRGLLRAQRHAARTEERGRHPQGAGRGGRRAGGRIVEGPADPADARHAGRAAQIHHRLPFERECAAGRAARRDPPAFGIDARLLLAWSSRAW